MLTGESSRDAINRLLRRSATRPGSTAEPLPLLPGRPVLDIADVSTVLATLDDRREMQSDA
jgi:hypothetical protein